MPLEDRASPNGKIEKNIARGAQMGDRLSFRRLGR
jgi:hypothetical protein